MKCFSLQACCPSSFTFCRAGEGGHFSTRAPSPLSLPLFSPFQPVKVPSVAVGVGSQQDHRLTLLAGVPQAPCHHGPRSPDTPSSWHPALAPHSSSARLGCGDALLVFDEKEVTPQMGPGQPSPRSDHSKSLASGSRHECFAEATENSLFSSIFLPEPQPPHTPL